MISKLLIGGIAAVLISGTSLFADDFDKQTKITLNEAVSVPGKTLPPGKYVMQLMSSSTNRNLVEIFNEDKSKLQVLIMALPNRRTTRPDKTVLTYWETPTGQPPALRAWFFPGDFVGQEFVYPKDEAYQISKNNHDAKVPSYEGTEQPTNDNVARLTVRDADNPAQVDTTPQTAPPQVASTTTTTPPVVAEEPNVPAPTPDTQALVAQNTPQTSPVQDAAPSSQANTPATTPDIDELPRTASSIPAILIGGLSLLSLAGLARFLRA